MRLDPGVVISEAIKATRAAMMFRNACARDGGHRLEAHASIAEDEEPGFRATLISNISIV